MARVDMETIGRSSENFRYRGTEGHDLTRMWRGCFAYCGDYLFQIRALYKLFPTEGVPFVAFRCDEGYFYPMRDCLTTISHGYYNAKRNVVRITSKCARHWRLGLHANNTTHSYLLSTPQNTVTAVYSMIQTDAVVSPNAEVHRMMRHFSVDFHSDGSLSDWFIPDSISEYISISHLHEYVRECFQSHEEDDRLEHEEDGVWAEIVEQYVSNAVWSAVRENARLSNPDPDYVRSVNDIPFANIIRMVNPFNPTYPSVSDAITLLSDGDATSVALTPEFALALRMLDKAYELVYNEHRVAVINPNNTDEVHIAEDFRWLEESIREVLTNA